MIAFFGIRGLGSFYYLAFALGQAEFDLPRKPCVVLPPFNRTPRRVDGRV